MGRVPRDVISSFSLLPPCPLCLCVSSLELLSRLFNTGLTWLLAGFSASDFCALSDAFKVRSFLAQRDAGVIESRCEWSLADSRRWGGDGPIRPTLQNCSPASVASSVSDDSGPDLFCRTDIYVPIFLSRLRGDRGRSRRACYQSRQVRRRGVDRPLRNCPRPKTTAYDRSALPPSECILPRYATNRASSRFVAETEPCHRWRRAG